MDHFEGQVDDGERLPSEEPLIALEESRVPDLEESSAPDSFLREVAQALPRMPASGTRLGGLDGARYEIRERIGGGGMGSVFKAVDHELGRTVALKFLYASGPGRVLRVREEAQAIARLDHENILRIHDVSIWNDSREGRVNPLASGVPFLVMEYLEGTSLQALLRRWVPDLSRGLDLMLDVAAALAHAHARGLIHRDLKPGNVFVLTNGRAKLLDFGLARIMTDLAVARGRTGSGTPAYMSPEQWEGRPLDARTDVWAAGLLLFELVTGMPPVPEANLQKLRVRITSDEPMPSARALRPELPEELVQLLASTLAKDPRARPPSGSELLWRLRALRERLSSRARSPRAHAAERRQVTLVSCSLTLAPPGARNVDPEDVNALEAAFHQASTALIREHGGTPTARIGTEVLACFGYPLAREDDSEQAVRAALRLTEALPRELSGMWPPGVAVKVGVHTGLVDLAGTPPEGEGLTPAMQGEAPRIAAWLARQAGPDTVLLSGETYGLVRSQFQARSLGPKVFATHQGPQPLGVLQVLQERRSVSRFDRALVVGALTPLVARSQELRRLLERWTQAMGGRGTSVLVRGEAGIGKSRLLQELHDRGTSQGAIWARCQCWLHFQGLAFHPLTSWLQRFLGMGPEDSVEQKRRRLREWLEALDLSLAHEPPLSGVLGLPLPDDSPFGRLSWEQKRQQSLGALTAFLQRLAVEQPLVLVVEDLHWADPSTLQFLGFLLGHIASARICVLLTTRSGFEPAWGGDAGPEVLELEPLSSQAALDMSRQVARGRELPGEMLEQLARRTDGIPLFIEELTRMVLERGDPTGSWLSSIPATLHELLLARLDQLPPELKSLVQLAACLGREFSDELLRAVALLGEDELQRKLGQLEQAGLLYQQGAAPNRSYAFRHALIQDAAYQSLPRGSRREYHALIVQVLAERFPVIAEEQPELLAQHATQAGQVSQAVDLWQRAGRRAGSTSALVEATGHFARALEQLALLPESSARNQREIALRVELGEAFISTRGQAAREVEDAYSRAYALCEASGEVPVPVLSGLWAVALLRGEREDTSRMARRFGCLLETHEDTAVRLVALFALAVRAFWRGEYVVCRHLCLRVKTLVREQHLLEHIGRIRGGSQGHAFESILYAYLYQARDEVMLGLAAHARESYDEAMALAETMHHPYAIATALMVGGAMAFEEERLEAARQVSERMIAIAAENKFQLILAVGQCIQGWATARLGDARTGIPRIQEGLEGIHAMGAMLTYPYYVRCLAEAALLHGQLPEGRAAVESGLELTRTNLNRCAIPELRRLRGEFLLLQGAEDAARADFLEALEVAREFGATLHGLRAASSLARLP